MKKVTKDNGYIMIQVPDRDISSMARFIAHAYIQNQSKDLNKIEDLMHNIVFGDLAKQDDYVNQLAKALDLEHWLIVLDGAEALSLCDELADTIYDGTEFGPLIKKQQEDEKPKLKLITICVTCQKSKIKGERCANCSK
jgi:hypothetical protein